MNELNNDSKHAHTDRKRKKKEKRKETKDTEKNKGVAKYPTGPSGTIWQPPPRFALSSASLLSAEGRGCRATASGAQCSHTHTGHCESEKTPDLLHLVVSTLLSSAIGPVESLGVAE